MISPGSDIQSNFLATIDTRCSDEASNYKMTHANNHGNNYSDSTKKQNVNYNFKVFPNPAGSVININYLYNEQNLAYWFQTWVIINKPKDNWIIKVLINEN